MTFNDLGLAEPILRAVNSEGYTVPTPIQAKAIPLVMSGRDLFGCAQTGTGKTAAFALPLLHRLQSARPSAGAGRRIRALILSPTRELAAQIADSFSSYGRNTPLRNSVIFGGVNQNPQVRALQKGIDILVATPGRLLDLMNQGHVDLRSVEVFILDEADRMLDLGFFPDIRRIVAKLPVERQTLLFSATMPDDIRQLAQSILRNPENVHVAPVATAGERIEQVVYHVSKRNKGTLLRHLLREAASPRTLVFTRTKRCADRVVRHLLRAGIRSAAIHGDKSQGAREKALEGFRAQRLPVLVATDIAARGIDVAGVTHVFNYDLPNVPETYVHRIGRTARAGASGIAVSFCDPEERGDLRAIERLIRQPLDVRNDHPDYKASDLDPADELSPIPPEGDSRPMPAHRSRRPSDRGRRPQSGDRPRQASGSRPQGGQRPAGGSATGGSDRSRHAQGPHANQGGSGSKSRSRRRRSRRNGPRKVATA